MRILIVLLMVTLIGTSTLIPVGTLAAGPTDAGKGFDVSNMDKTCKPCADFYQYSNGGWMARTPIPAAYSRWGSFNELNDRNMENQRLILEELLKSTTAAKGSNEQKLRDFYASGMDEAAIEAAGIKPLQPELDRIEAISDLAGLQTAIAHLHSLGVGAVFAFGSEQDAKNSQRSIAGATQGGLGLPERDYYFDTEDKSKETREKYVAHVANMFQLLGKDQKTAASHAKSVMAIETKLAEASMTQVELRDPKATYNLKTLAELKKLTPNFSWPAYFKVINAPGVKEVNVGQLKFFQAVNTLLTEIPIPEWKIYLHWHLVSEASPFLSSKFVDENFAFYSAYLEGKKENQPRWKRVVGMTDTTLGEALGQMYVEKYFSAQAKQRVLEMVANIKAAFQEKLSGLPWMSPQTRKQAIAKLNKIVTKIGYPDKWQIYKGLEVSRESYLANIMASQQFEFARQLRKIGKPVDRTEWGITPPTVNAYYDPLMNEIVFPAGILQPPFFDPNADDAVNYGGMGAVIGHEIIHGFDDQGRQFDKDGNLKDWWTGDDETKFIERATCVEQQFSGYEVEKGVSVNGKLVLGESIADLGGLTISFAALQRALAGKPRPAEIDGFSPEQRFFLGWAQVWRTNMRPEFARYMVQVDPHPPAKFRVNGPLSNMPEFTKAFGCKSGESMVRASQCQIW